MRLKSIKLAGFKSFVDATTVSFPHNMTAIVGPNGCGKSNVIDAVRWVMGESSAKNLRGESMTDVIFNGSAARQPVGQASIELLFDNSQGKLAGEYAAFNEISIKRKVTRDGQSQYYLNGSKCRRRDVTDIFLGTGMGPRSYAIIEQGMISRLIESKPEELRVYLEEAAGISKYKERRRDTENRIARTQENLDRLSDIRDELGKQLAHLQRQAKAAERYKEYKKEERLLVAKKQASMWRDFGHQLTDLDRSIAAEENAVEQSVLGRTEADTLIEKCKLEYEEKHECFSQTQAKFYEAGAEVGKAAEVHDIGTLVTVIDWNQLPNGMLGVTVQGGQKFRVLSTHTEANQLVTAEVSLLPGEAYQPVAEHYDPLVALLEELMSHPAIKRLELEFDPSDARQLGWLLGQLLPLNDGQKLELLALLDPLQRLERINEMLDNMTMMWGA